MLDQATSLRALMRRGAACPSRPQRTTVICGSQRGVGTTTIAANLAVLIGRQQRVRLVTARDVVTGCRTRVPTRADWLMIDGGHATSPETSCLWSSADEILLVTPPDTVAIMDAYAAIKLQTPPGRSLPIRIVLNQASQRSSSGDAFARLQRSCERFLALQLNMCGAVPLDPNVIAATQHAAPVCMRYPQCAASQELRSIAETLLAASEGHRP